MISIYCIEDINGLKYVGSTNQTLIRRFVQHKADKKMNRNCSSKLLDLDNCKIYELEECDESNRKEREQYWINNTDCVNQRNRIFDKQYQEHIKEYQKQYNIKNKERKKQYNIKIYHYQNSWGGEKRTHNNLLKIDLSLFN